MLGKWPLSKHQPAGAEGTSIGRCKPCNFLPSTCVNRQVWQNHKWTLGVGRGSRLVRRARQKCFHLSCQEINCKRERMLWRALSSLPSGLSSPASFREPSVDVSRKCWLGADKGARRYRPSGTCVNVRRS